MVYLKIAVVNIQFLIYHNQTDNLIFQFISATLAIMIQDTSYDKWSVYCLLGVFTL